MVITMTRKKGKSTTEGSTGEKTPDAGVSKGQQTPQSGETTPKDGGVQKPCPNQNKKEKQESGSKNPNQGEGKPQGWANDPIFYGHSIPDGLIGLDTSRRIRTKSIELEGKKISAGWHTKVLTLLNPGLDPEKSLLEVFGDDYRYLRTHVRGTRYYNQYTYGAYDLNLLTAAALLATAGRNVAVASVPSNNDRADYPQVLATICFGNTTQTKANADEWSSIETRNKLAIIASRFQNLPAGKSYELGKLVAMYKNIFAVSQNEVAVFRAFCPAKYFTFEATGKATSIVAACHDLEPTWSGVNGFKAALETLYDLCSSFAEDAGFIEIMQGDIEFVMKSPLAFWDFEFIAKPAYGIAEWTLTQWRWLNLNTPIRETVGAAENYALDFTNQTLLVKDGIVMKDTATGRIPVLPKRNVSGNEVREIMSWSVVSAAAASETAASDVTIIACTSNLPIKIEEVYSVDNSYTYSGYAVAKLMADSHSTIQSVQKTALRELLKIVRYDPTFPVFTLDDEGTNLDIANPPCVPTGMTVEELKDNIQLSNRSTYSLIKPKEEKQESGKQ